MFEMRLNKQNALCFVAVLVTPIVVSPGKSCSRHGGGERGHRCCQSHPGAGMGDHGEMPRRT